MISVLFSLNWQLALVALLPLPFASWIVFRSVAKTRASWRPVRERLADLTAQVQDNLAGVTVIKSFVQEQRHARDIEIRSQRLRDDMLRASMRSFVPVGVIEATNGVGVILIVLLGGMMALSGSISAADLFVFIVYLTQIYQPFLQLANMNDTLQKATVSLERVFELLALSPDIVSPPHGLRPTPMTWDIALQGVTFAYQPDRPVLHDVNMEIAEGAIVALVGATGAGKTTVTNLIPRFYDPQEGSVRLGGHDVLRVREDGDLGAQTVRSDDVDHVTELLRVIRPPGNGMARTIDEADRRNFQPVPVHHAEDAHIIEALRGEQCQVVGQPRTIVLCVAQGLKV